MREYGNVTNGYHTFFFHFTWNCISLHIKIYDWSVGGQIKCEAMNTLLVYDVMIIIRTNAGNVKSDKPCFWKSPN